jgi:ArsR family transcriptional regulator, arsenate/arsenite/antimonite-responsive transcriptional repressor / arsenate reductase (thioredoxin)
VRAELVNTNLAQKRLRSLITNNCDRNSRTKPVDAAFAFRVPGWPPDRALRGQLVRPWHGGHPLAATVIPADTVAACLLLNRTGLMYFGWVSAPPGSDEIRPPAFLRLAGHPVRWRLLSELARSDLRVHELTALAGRRQNAVSYHLARLREGGLVTVHRSSADRRDSYYRIELGRCGQLLADTAGALHPGLLPGAPPAASRATSRPAAPVRVLFLCTGNSARSQIAEALLRRAGGDRVRAASAGSHPKDLHPRAVRVLREYGIDWSGRRSRHLSEFADRPLDLVITLCDRAREVCPEFPGRPETAHWSIPDPAADGSAAGYPAFQRTAADLSARIGFLVRRITPLAR